MGLLGGVCETTLANRVTTKNKTETAKLPPVVGLKVFGVFYKPLVFLGLEFFLLIGAPFVPFPAPFLVLAFVKLRQLGYVVLVFFYVAKISTANEALLDYDGDTVPLLSEGVFPSLAITYWRIHSVIFPTPRLHP